MSEPLLWGEFAEAGHRVRRCGMQRRLDELTEADRVVVQQALDTKSVTATAIARVLDQHGWHVDITTIGRHRRGTCGCGHGNSA